MVSGQIVAQTQRPKSALDCALISHPGQGLRTLVVVLSIIVLDRVAPESIKNLSGRVFGNV